MNETETKTNFNDLATKKVINFETTPIVDIVNYILVTASKKNASDIHFDPADNYMKVRFRIDGKLDTFTIVPNTAKQNLIARLKIMAGMNITETRLPQDGAIRTVIEGISLDMRVSSLPTKRGEKIVIRIMDYSMSLKGLESLCFNDVNYKKILKMISEPNGIILVTGATGSGKSTTVYSLLQRLNTEDTNLITVEDPVEMEIEGMNQVQVNSEIGLTFAAVLRSILRQDPNIILIGEIRDSETAQIAVRASITGHLVLSTIHTNDSLSTIERLLDMDVERYLLSSALTGIISQKLVRTLCPHCRKKRPVTPYEEHFFMKVLHKYVSHVYEPVGCEYCNHGFKGRMAVHEVLYITDHLRDVISDANVDKEQLRDIVYNKEQVTTLLQDALEKVIEGHTTFNEVVRIVEVDADLEKSVVNEVEETEIKTKAKFEKKLEDQLEIIDAFELEVIDAYAPEIEIIDMYDKFLLV